MKGRWGPLCVGIVFALTVSSASASTMSVVQNLSFGTWVPSGSSGSINVTNTGGVSQSGVTAAPSGAGAFQGILKFTGTGLGTLLDVIVLSPQSSSVTLSNGAGGTVTVSNFVPQTGLGVNLLNPNVNIGMGGTLNFSSLPSGTYTGSVQVQGSGLLSGTATATLPISVTFWRVLSVTETTQLNFGAIEARGGAAVVRASSAGLRTIVSGSGGINLVPSPTPTAGQFSVTGQPSTNVTVTVPSAITLTGSSGGTMSVTNLTTAPATKILNASGNMTLFVGGDLAIGSTQAAGTYSGTYQVTVNY